MRVLFLVRSLGIGGAESQLALLASGLRGRGDEVSVAVLYPGGVLEEGLRACGVRVLSLDKRGRWDLLAFARRLVALVAAERPNVVHGYLTAGNLLSALLRLRFRSLRVVWGLRASDMDLGHYDAWVGATSRLESLFARWSDRIIVNSAAGKRHAIRSGFPEAKMVVIPNGIDTERFRPLREGGEEVRRAWGIDAAVKVVGLVARLDPMKDHALFLKAAARMRTALAVRFVCIGSGPSEYRARLERQATDLGISDRVLWAGNRLDMPEVYNALDLLVLCSSFGEGFPNVIGEAMACGVRSVVTDVGDAASIVGESGRVVPRGDATLLATAIDAALAVVPSAAERAALRDRIRVNYGVDRLVETTRAVLAKTAAVR